MKAPQLSHLRLPGLLLTACLAINACSQHQAKPPAVEEPAPPVAEIPPPSKPFEAHTLYSLLVAEVAGNRNRFDIMLGNYVQQAEATRDPEVVARAARLGRYLNAGPVALHMAQLWVDVAPTHIEARQSLLSELLNANRLPEALQQGEFLLSQDTESGLDIVAAKATQSEPSQGPALLPLYRALQEKYPRSLSLLLGASYLLHHQGQNDEALVMANKAALVKADDINVISQQTRLLLQMGRVAEAQAQVKKMLDLQPDNTRLRLQYAKSLAGQNLPAAEEQFAILLTQAPEDPDLNLAMALILLEQNKLPEAQSRFSSLISHPKYGSSAHYYLGRIAQQGKDIKTALEHYRQVGPGNDLLPAMAQYSQLMIAQGRAEEALAYVRSKNTSDDTQGLTIVEANLLGDMGNNAQAEALLNQQLSRHPDSVQLLYSRAMLYSRLHKDALSEQDLRKILTLNPQHAAALNALGYGLSNRPAQLDEAAGYVLRALQLAPQDPAIMDSLGWIYFQQGKHREALKLLRQAFALLPDHEIGAHLGEALWVNNNKTEARKIWRQSLANNPNSSTLKETLNRLQVTLD